MAHLLHYLDPRSRRPHDEPLRSQRLFQTLSNRSGRHHSRHHRRSVEAAFGQDSGYLGTTAGSGSDAAVLGARLHHDGCMPQRRDLRSGSGILYSWVSSMGNRIKTELTW